MIFHAILKIETAIQIKTSAVSVYQPTAWQKMFFSDVSTGIRIYVLNQLRLIGVNRFRAYFKEKPAVIDRRSFYLAEEVGFEPTYPCG